MQSTIKLYFFSDREIQAVGKGVLTINLPKSQEARKKEIKIKIH
jgi:HSP20 family molecular chaperone IbpA